MSELVGEWIWFIADDYYEHLYDPTPEILINCFCVSRVFIQGDSSGEVHDVSAEQLINQVAIDKNCKNHLTV